MLYLRQSTGSGVRDQERLLFWNLFLPRENGQKRVWQPLPQQHQKHLPRHHPDSSLGTEAKSVLVPAQSAGCTGSTNRQLPGRKSLQQSVSDPKAALGPLAIQE